MRNTSILGALVAVAISVGGRLAAMHFLKMPPVPPIQITMPNGMPLPNGSPLPQLQPMGLPFPVTSPSGLSFPTPSTLLGRGPAPAPVRTTARRGASRSVSPAPYSPAKSIRGTARPAPSPTARVAGPGRGAQATPGQ